MAGAERLAAWMRKDGLQDVAVATELGPGAPPAVTGCVHGRTGQEILVAVPMGEAGAGDNVPGVAVALGIGRMLAAAGRGKWRPERGVRFLFAVEPRGLKALLSQQPRLFRRVVLGLTMMSGEQDVSGAVLTIKPSPPPSPDSFLPVLLRSLAACPGLRWEVGPSDGGHLLDDPLLGFSTTRIVLASERSGFGKKGRPESPSTAVAGRIGLWLGGHIGYLCSAGPAEVCDMARLGVRYARRRLAEVSDGLDAAGTARSTFGNTSPYLRTGSLRYHTEQERLRLTGLLKLIPVDSTPVWVGEAYPALPPVDRRGLFPEVAAREYVRRLADRLEAPAREAEGKAAAAAGCRDVPALRRVPLKVCRGSLDTGMLAPEVRRLLSRVAGVDIDREAPCWLQWALGWSNGKRTLDQIGDKLRYEGCNVPPARLARVFGLFAREGLVRWRTRLTGRDIDRALRRVGVRPGMLLMTHSSLSAFGYVEGGARVVIDRLQATVGPRGTLAMPTHTVSTFGQPVYDAARTPSTVGAITDVFRRLDGVRRSPHPTHSVAVRGPLAEALTAGHTGEMAPLAREGFWGRFVDHDGCVLMMSPIRKNTLMHAAELWSGVKLPGMIPAGPPGRRGAARVIPSGPWHNNWFDLAHEQMKSRGLIASAPLGEGTIYLMQGRDVVEAGMAVLRNDPLQVTKKNCHCEWCEIVRRRNGVVVKKED